METRAIAFVVLSLVVASCSVSPGPLTPIELAAISPSEMLEGDSVNARITGQGFHLALRADLDNDQIVGEPVAATLGTYPLANVVLESETVVAATVPPNVPLGVYDLTVIFPDGRTDTLAKAFVIRRACNGFGQCMTQDPCNQYQCVDGMCERTGDKDSDGDGFVDAACGGDDCDDEPSRCGADCSPAGSETMGQECNDGFDNDCDGEVDGC